MITRVLGMTSFTVLCLSSLAASAYDACEPFTVIWAVDHVVSFDHGQDGRSIGDEMLVRGDMFDLDGTRVGTMFVDAKVMPYSEATEDHEMIPFLTIMHHIFPKGSLTTSGVFERHDTGTNKNITPVEYEYPIIGGTKAFSNATGMMIASTDEDGQRRLSFQPRCTQ